MPFLAPIAAGGGLFAGFFGFLAANPIITGLIVTGLGIAAKFAAKAIFGQPESPAPQVQPQASQLQTVYGDTQARTIILGQVGTAGHHVYRNAYGPGNTIIQDVYVLSHFRIGSVSRVRHDGTWHTITGAVDSEKGQRIDGVDAEIWIKVYTGAMDQTADNGLIARANPASRWGLNHRGAGVAYAIVTQVLDRDRLPQPWQPFFEVIGAPLYDWRKDSTAGGSGSHRWNNQSTWEYSVNPIVMMFALERGIFNGTEMMVGKGVDASRLPLANWTLAANICDEIVGGGRRYQAACIVSSGSGSTHDANMAPLLESCAGSWLELPGAEYPIAGATQTPVATITDDDIVQGEAFRYSAFRSRTELVNTVAGTWVSPDAFYEPVAFATRIDDGALAADRERLAVSIPFRAVTVAAVADRLADIAIRASRYQANAEICVRPKFLALVPGQWVEWDSARYGTRTFQVLSKGLGPYGGKAVRSVYLTLQEVADGVFDPTAYATLPPDATGQGAPDYVSELEDFTVAPYGVIDTESGKRFPAIRAQWNGIDDPTVTGILLRYRPQFQTEAEMLHPQLPPSALAAVITNGLVSNTDYQVAYRLVTVAGRVQPPWSEWVTVRTPDIPLTDILVTLANVQNDVRNLFGQLARRFDEEVVPYIEQLALNTALGTGANRQDLAAVRRTANALAASFLVLDAIVTDEESGNAALATALLGVQAEVGNVSAGGLIRIQAAVPPPEGVYSQIEILARATVEGEFLQAGQVIQVYLDGTDLKSRIVNMADQFIISDGVVGNFPFDFQGGVLTLNSMRAKTITAGRFQNAENTRWWDFSTGAFSVRF